METLKEMQTFLRVVQAGSLSAAARQMGTSAASVSRTIKSLEETLDVGLLHRSSRNVSLTEAGEVYLKHVERVFFEIQDMHEAVAHLSQVPRGSLHVFAKVFVGLHHVVPALPSFLQRYPDIRMVLTLSDERVDPAELNVDVIIHSGKLEESSLIARTLASTRRVVCASREYLRSHSPPLTLDDLDQHNCLTYRFDEGKPVWRFRGADGVREMRLESYVETNDAEALRMMALSGIGLALLPEWSVLPELRDGRLLRVLAEFEATPADAPFEHKIYAIYKPTRHISPKVRAFIDHIAETFRANQSEGWGHRPFDVVHGLTRPRGA